MAQQATAVPAVESDFRTQSAILSVEQTKQAMEEAKAACTTRIMGEAVTNARKDHEAKLKASSAIIPLLVKKLDLASDEGEAFIPSYDKNGIPQGSKDGLTIKGHIERELLRLTKEQTVTILTEYDKQSNTLTAACGSCIITALQDSRGVENSATDNKLWKAVKAGVESELSLLGIFQFPASWETYWSVIRKFLQVGGVVTECSYVNEHGAECIRSIRWFATERKLRDKSPKTTKSERIGDSIESQITAALGGEDGKGEQVSPDSITVSAETAKYMLEVAESTLGSQRCRDLVTHVADPVERIIARLLSEYSVTDLVQMIEQQAA